MQQEHIALHIPNPNTEVPLVRIHSECLTGDVFMSSRCDCGEQLNVAIEKISTVGGIIIYLRQEGRGIGLYPKIDAYALQEIGCDTYEANRMLGFSADSRSFSVAVEMLKTLNVHQVDLLTNNPEKVSALIAGGLSVRNVLNTKAYIKDDNRKYLKAKVEFKNHEVNVK